MSQDLEPKNVRTLLQGNTQFVVPMYQRNYAWEEGEITQLVQDVLDSIPKKDTPPKTYYLGSLVVWDSPSHNGLEVIDGQQRLTTLVLLLSYLKRNAHALNADPLDWFSTIPLSFATRESSNQALHHLHSGKQSDNPMHHPSLELQPTILDGFQILQKVVPQKLREYNVGGKQFVDYLCENVVILQVKVPSDTDLNHYFEIMNNRGEQLEKHEVLKARLLEKLNSIPDLTERQCSQNCLQLVWEACENMEKYVQSGFEPELRHILFGKNDWSKLVPRNYDELISMLPCKDFQPSNLDLDQILARPIANQNMDADEDLSPERFHAVINFPNFLLQVLRIFLHKDIPLDDKRLLPLFDDHILNGEDSIAKVQYFTYALLKCKYLFDHFILKREYLKGSDGWSLKSYKWSEGGTRKSQKAYYANTFGKDDSVEGDNRQVLMIQAALHVSTPTLVYKHWLNAALLWLYNAPIIELDTFLPQLDAIAKSFVFDRFLAKSPLDYYQIIFENHCQIKNRKLDFADGNWHGKLKYGAIENNLVFNYLDYLLWRKTDYRLDSKAKEKIRQFEFTFRSSVEHYYPQHPLEGLPRLNDNVLNCFGNLCLISHNMNSRLSNLTPKGKQEYYAANAMDSIKQFLMMNQYEEWNERSILDHDKAMADLLMDELL